MKIWIKYTCKACNGVGQSGSTESCPICMGNGYLTEIIEVIDYKFID
jgi:DnaJ-class molecular chaperone